MFYVRCCDGPTYTAREWDGEVGLYYYRNRYYEPRIGRFISEDPLGLVQLTGIPRPGILPEVTVPNLDPSQFMLSPMLAAKTNLYAYVGNSPLTFVDPLGLFTWPGYVGTLSMGYGGGVVLGVFAGATPVGWAFLIGGGALVLYDLYSGIEWGEQTGKEIGEIIEEHNRKQKEIIDDICK